MAEEESSRHHQTRSRGGDDMNRVQRAAVLTELVEELRIRGSWCGEAHLQKAVYFLQELLQVNTGFHFMLYRYGPFSFDLRDELTSLRADELLRLELQPLPYSPRIAPTARVPSFQANYSRTLRDTQSRIAFVAAKLGGYGVAELEPLATALYVTINGDRSASVEERSERLSELKRHVSSEKARKAVLELDEMSGLVERMLEANTSNGDA